MSTQKPTIIFICGAWHPPHLYSSFLSLLTGQGYKVHAPRLASLNSSVTSIAEDIALIRSLITTAADASESVVLVMHSYGGFPGSGAIESLSYSARQEAGLPGGVIKLVYFCAFVPKIGQRLVDLSVHNFSDPSAPRPIIRDPENDAQIICVDPSIFYTNVDEHVVEKVKADLEPHAAGVFGAKAEYEGWRDVESVYLICEKDQSMPAWKQEEYTRLDGARFAVERCGEGHSPFLSDPELVAKVVRRAAGETV